MEARDDARVIGAISSSFGRMAIRDILSARYARAAIALLARASVAGSDQRIPATRVPSMRNNFAQMLRLSDGWKRGGARMRGRMNAFAS